MAGDDTPEDEGGSHVIRETIITIVLALGIAWGVQAYLVKPFQIPSGSMENTIRCKDRILANRIGMHLGGVERGDVVVFHPPAGTGPSGKPDPALVAGIDDGAEPWTGDGEVPSVAAGENYIKRLVAEPGDEVEVRDHHVYIDGEAVEDPYVHLSDDSEGAIDGHPLADWGPHAVPKGTYLMMGDHRDRSADGRVFGFVPADFVVGKAFMVYWPPSRAGRLPTEDPGGTSGAEPDPGCIEAGDTAA